MTVMTPKKARSSQARLVPRAVAEAKPRFSTEFSVRNGDNAPDRPVGGSPWVPVARWGFRYQQRLSSCCWELGREGSS